MTLTPAPTLRTERLILRGPEQSDIEQLVAFYADPARSHGFGGTLPRDQVWRWFASVIGHWHLRGFGFWTVIADGIPVGMVGLWEPEGWPEPELGWLLFEGHEGKGYAREAAHEVRHYAYEVLGWDTLTSNIVPDNTRSMKLATKLGAWFEKTYDNINMGEDQLWRHPGPEALA